MLGHRELTMEDYAGILKRRFWLILISAITFLGVGIGVTYILHAQYVSQTLVLIEQQKVPENYVKPVVAEDLGARLASMREQILSRSRLEPIIDEIQLVRRPWEHHGRPCQLTQKAIGLHPIPLTVRGQGDAGLLYHRSRRRTRARPNRYAAKSLRSSSARI